MEMVLEEPGGCSGLVEPERRLPFCRDDLSLGCGSVADDPAARTGDEDGFAWAGPPRLDDLEASSASEAVRRCIRCGRDCGMGGACESVTWGILGTMASVLSLPDGIRIGLSA